MAKTFDISRVGHVGIQVTDFDRSLQWYTQTLGLTLTGKWPMGEDGAIAFMRFNEDHHNIVLFTHPTEVDDETKNLGYNGLQHIAMEVEDRDEWLKALADLRRKRRAHHPRADDSRPRRCHGRACQLHGRQRQQVLLLQGPRRQPLGDLLRNDEGAQQRAVPPPRIRRRIRQPSSGLGEPLQRHAGPVTDLRWNLLCPIKGA